MVWGLQTGQLGGDPWRTIAWTQLQYPKAQNSQWNPMVIVPIVKFNYCYHPSISYIYIHIYIFVYKDIVGICWNKISQLSYYMLFLCVLLIYIYLHMNKNMYMYMYICVYVYMYICIYIYIYVNICICIFISMQIYVYVLCIHYQALLITDDNW